MTRKNDILTPEGYFENLQDRLSQIPARQQPVSTVRRIAPYFAYAASLLVAVMLGNAVLKKTAAPAQDDNWTYVSYLADALDPDGAALYEEDEWYEDGEQDLSEDDIINYLIADGISVEHLNYVNYEEGY
ncbi:MAG: hypothetical protein II874_04680 [Bacteroidales bacterium]|nr:hypothetical protein [Bacteroidales bacterium]